jgi:hypothetical protein
VRKEEEKAMDSVHGPWTTSSLGPRWSDGGEGSGGGALSAGSLGAQREGKEGQGRSGEERGCQGFLL